MNKAQALAALKRIIQEPGIADQYTEEEIEKLEELAARRQRIVSVGLIILVGLIYLYVAVDQFVKGNPGMSICYLSYALAQVGWYWIAVK